VQKLARKSGIHAVPSLQNRPVINRVAPSFGGIALSFSLFTALLHLQALPHISSFSIFILFFSLQASLYTSSNKQGVKWGTYALQGRHNRVCLPEDQPLAWLDAMRTAIFATRDGLYLPQCGEIDRRQRRRKDGSISAELALDDLVIKS
jgi:hypothetical protein